MLILRNVSTSSLYLLSLQISSRRCLTVLLIASHWWILACTACWSSYCGHMTLSHSNVPFVPSLTYAKRESRPLATPTGHAHWQCFIISCSESISLSVASLNCATPLLHIMSSYDTVSRHLSSDLLLLLSQQPKLQEQIHDSDCLPQCLRCVNFEPSI